MVGGHVGSRHDAAGHHDRRRTDRDRRRGDARITFSSEPGATFECKLDGAAYASCTSPASYTDLTNGAHDFAVRATDAAGNVDPTPATAGWIVTPRNAGLSIGLSGPDEVAVDDGKYTPDPFEVRATVRNPGDADATAANVTLYLPAGLEFAPGSPAAARPLGTLQARGQRVVTWSVRAAGVSTDRTLSYLATVSATNVTTRPSARRDIRVPALFGIRDFEPSRGGNAGPVTVDVLGSKFEPGATVKIGDVTGRATRLVSQDQIRATFDLTGQGSGALPVTVASPDGTRTVAAKQFTVVDGGRAVPTLTVLMRPEFPIRVGQARAATPFTVCLSNDGLVDLKAAVRVTGTVGNSLGATAPTSEAGESEGTGPLGLNFAFETSTGSASATVYYNVPPQGLHTSSGSFSAPGVSREGSVNDNCSALRTAVEQASIAYDYASEALRYAIGGVVNGCGELILSLAYPAIAAAFSGGIASGVVIAAWIADDRFNTGPGCISALTNFAGRFFDAGIADLKYTDVLGRWLKCVEPGPNDPSDPNDPNPQDPNPNDPNPNNPNPNNPNPSNPNPNNPNPQDPNPNNPNPNNPSNPKPGAFPPPVPPGSGATRPRRLRAFDPNDKYGAAGSGVRRYVQGTDRLIYDVVFENLPTATAPAQEVVVADQLDPKKVDLSTFTLGPITFGSRTVPVPPGRSQFATDVDLRPARDLILRINAGIDQATGLVTWRFLSLDPATMLPTEDALAGFLPPNKTSPEGQGEVLFFVRPRAGLPSRTEIRNRARIVFDTEAPIDTPYWLNTIDRTRPTSKVRKLAKTHRKTRFRVRWAGSDPKGAGVSTYNVYVSEDDGRYRPWLLGTRKKTAIFRAHPGTRYRFHSLASDKVGNVERAPKKSDAATGVRIASRITSMRIRARTFKAVPMKAPTATGKPGTIPFGALATFRMNGPAKVALFIERGSRCSSGRCRAYRRLGGTLSTPGRTGTNFYALSGRLRKRQLAPGRYLLVAVPRNRYGLRGPAVRSSFRIVK